VSVDEFGRGFDWRRARKADRNSLASVNPVLDPLLLTPLRNAVVNSAWGRGKKDIPPGIARKLNDTPVITSTRPIEPAFRRDLAKSMRVETVSDRAKGQKLKVRDERQGGKGAVQQTSQASAQVRQPDRAQPVEPRREARRVEQEQRKQERQPQRVDRERGSPQAERAARPVRQQQPQAERVAAPARSEPRSQPQPRREVAPQQQQQKQERPGKAQPEKGGGKGKGKKP